MFIWSRFDFNDVFPIWVRKKHKKEIIDEWNVFVTMAALLGYEADQFPHSDNLTLSFKRVIGTVHRGRVKEIRIGVNRNAVNKLKSVHVWDIYGQSEYINSNPKDMIKSIQEAGALL